MPQVDAVYIPLPNSAHAEWARRGLAAGKHVLIEKPAVTDPTAATALVALAEERGLLVMENFAFLKHPQHSQARALLNSGVIGEVRAFSGAFAIPPTDFQGIRYQAELCGGSLWEVGCYPIRAAQEYLKPPLQVLGASLKLDPKLGVDTSGAALLHDCRGVTAYCAFGFVHSYRSTYELWGSCGRLVLDWAFTPTRDARPVLRLYQKDRETRYLAAPADQFVGVMTAFFDAMRDPRARLPHHCAMVRQAELMAEVQSRTTPTT